MLISTDINVTSPRVNINETRSIAKGVSSESGLTSRETVSSSWTRVDGPKVLFLLKIHFGYNSVAPIIEFLWNNGCFSPAGTIKIVLVVFPLTLNPFMVKCRLFT
jgi:hypothetical protein